VVAFVVASCFALPGVSEAQVVISEKVDLGLISDSTRGLSKATLTSIVPTISGALCALYAPASRLGTPILPDSGVVTVTKNIDTLATDELRSRLPTQSTAGHVYCDGGNVTLYSYDNQSMAQKWWKVGSVAALDDITFSYTSDRGVFGGVVQDFGGNVWNVKMGDLRCLRSGL